MYFSASRAENFIHGRLRPVRILSGGPCLPATRIFPPDSARPAGRATGNRAARNGPRTTHLYPRHSILHNYTYAYMYTYFTCQKDRRGKSEHGKLPIVAEEYFCAECIWSRLIIVRLASLLAVHLARIGVRTVLLLC
jgi:hypothetical protein